MWGTKQLLERGHRVAGSDTYRAYTHIQRDHLVFATFGDSPLATIQADVDVDTRATPASFAHNPFTENMRCRQTWAHQIELCDRLQNAVIAVWTNSPRVVWRSLRHLIKAFVLTALLQNLNVTSLFFSMNYRNARWKQLFECGARISSPSEFIANVESYSLSEGKLTASYIRGSNMHVQYILGVIPHIRYCAPWKIFLGKSGQFKNHRSNSHASRAFINLCSKHRCMTVQ